MSIYLGRIVAAGLTRDGKAVAAYRVSSRSFPNRTANLKDNQISKPVKTQFGWHIIKREALRKSEVKPFAEVQSQLLSFLQGQKEQELLQKYIKDLETKAKVKILVPKPAMPMMPGM